MVSAANAPDQAGPRKWILVADDDPGVRGLWVEALKQAGYAAVGAADGLTASHLVHDVFPDLIVLDLKMPHTSGQEFLEHARTRSGLEIPVLIVSGHPEEAPPERLAPGLHIIGRLQKPISPAILVARVREAVGARAPAAPRQTRSRSDRPGDPSRNATGSADLGPASDRNWGAGQHERNGRTSAGL